MRAERERIKTEIARFETELATRRHEILSELNEELSIGGAPDHGLVSSTSWLPVSYQRSRRAAGTYALIADVG